ncbi:hypothetical protein RD279_004794 [Salmonella enterica]|nr:hypothetical protein [Salmonella enterica]
MRYILFILILTGGLLSFNSYSRGLSDEPLTGLNYMKPVSSCSASAPPVTGSFTFTVINGVTHANINGCDYVLPPDSPVLESDGGFCGGNVVCSQDYTWYPTGDSGIGESNKPQPIISGDSDTSQDVVDKINEQTNRYCSQTKKCDSDGEPVDINDFMEFKKKDDSAHNNPSEKPGDKPSDKPGSGSSGETGGASGGSSGSSTPSPAEPEKPYPDNAGASQLLDLYDSCYKQAYSIPLGDEYNNAFNSVIRNCNAILKQLSSVLAPNEMSSLSADGQKFLTKSDAGVVLSCHKTSNIERQQMIANGYYPSLVPDVIGSTVRGIPYRDGHLNFNYNTNGGANAYCDSVYQNYIASQNKPSDNSDNNSPSNESSDNTGGASSGFDSESCPPDYHLSDVDGKTCFKIYPDGQVGTILPPDCPPGSDCFNSVLEAGRLGAEHFKASVASSAAGAGHSESGDGDNGDVVAAINAFHADANKNHKEAMDALDTSGTSLDGAKAGLASDINSLIDSLKKEMTDSYNEALKEFKDVFGDIDSYIPDIELSFNLPVQFTNGIMGHCVPLVFDFNITLVGFQPYHFHAEGVQACQLYDAYIRSIVEYMLYFLTALACRRVFTRAAEFVSSQP